MRLLLATDLYHPIIGGAERQMRLLAAELLRRGHDVRVVTTAQRHLPAAERIDDVEVHRLGSLATALPFVAADASRRFLPPAPDPRLVVGMRRLLGAWPADVVHASGWIAYAAAVALDAHGPTPLVISVRDYGYACATRNLLRRDRAPCDGPALARCLDCAGRRYGASRALVAVAGVRTGRPLLRRTVSGIHSVSRFVEQTVRRDLLGADPGWHPALERIPDIVPAVDGGVFRLTRRQQALASALPEQPFILFVGALQRLKGLDVLLDAYTRLALRPGGRPPLVLIGTRWADTPRTFPADVTVLTDVPHAVVMTAWERSLFGVTPSIWPDPLPGTVREAMARGRAVIATATGGNPDMVTDGETGLLVRPGDPVELAAAMARLVDDPASRDRLGEAGRRSVVELTPPHVAARFESLYGQAIESRRAGRGARGAA